MYILYITNEKYFATDFDQVIENYVILMELISLKYRFI